VEVPLIFYNLNVTESTPSSVSVEDTQILFVCLVEAVGMGNTGFHRHMWVTIRESILEVLYRN
jgi:hypothetical protein